MGHDLAETLGNPIRVAIIDEHELFRAGLSSLLSQHKNLEVVSIPSLWPEAMKTLQHENPEVVLFTIDAAGKNIDLIPEILAVSEESKVLALSDTTDQELLRRMVRQGASGVLSKNQSPAMLIKAIECVDAGEAWLDRSTTASLLQELSPKRRVQKQDPEQMKIDSLTEREREVIELLGKGLKNRQIAKKLFISDVTVHHHLSSIYSKLAVEDRLELLIYAYRNGLAQLPGL